MPEAAVSMICQVHMVKHLMTSLSIALTYSASSVHTHTE